MIDELSNERLMVHTNFINVADAQRSRVEKILDALGASAEWSPAVLNVESFSNSTSNSGTAVWSVFFSNIDPDKLQLALDEAQ